MGSLRSMGGQPKFAKEDIQWYPIVKKLSGQETLQNIDWNCIIPAGMSRTDHMKSFEYAVFLAFAKIEDALDISISDHRYIITGSDVFGYLCDLQDFSLLGTHNQRFPCLYGSVKVYGLEVSIVRTARSVGPDRRDSAICYYLDPDRYPIFYNHDACRLNIV